VPSAGERPLPSSSIVIGPLPSFDGSGAHLLYHPFEPRLQLVFPSLASYMDDEQKDLEQCSKLAQRQLLQLFQSLQPKHV